VPIKLALLNLPWHGLHRAHKIVDEPPLGFQGRQAKEVASLRVVIIALAMVVAVGGARNFERRFFIALVFLGTAK
jgi:hypothetical protein